MRHVCGGGIWVRGGKPGLDYLQIKLVGKLVTLTSYSWCKGGDEKAKERGGSKLST